GELRDGYLSAIRRRYEDAIQVRNVCPKVSSIANVDRISFAAFDRRRDGGPTDGGLDDTLNFPNREAVPRGLLTPDLKVEIVTTCDTFEERTARPLNRLQYFLKLQSDLLDRVEIRTKNLDAYRCSNSRRDHVDTCPYWEEPGICERWNMNRVVHFFLYLLPSDGNIFRPKASKCGLQNFRAAIGIPTVFVYLPPVLLRLQHYGRLYHTHGCRIGSRLRFANLSENSLDLGKLHQQLVLELKVFCGFGYRNPRQSNRHIQDRA